MAEKLPFRLILASGDPPGDIRPGNGFELCAVLRCEQAHRYPTVIGAS